MPKMAEELKMSKPFAHIEEEAMLSILRTADVIQQRAGAVLKEHDITAAQYNVLRILNGSEEGLCCREISERLIARDPDITRLLDRMEARQWIKRKRLKADRRVVLACIEKSGVRLLDQLAPRVNAHHLKQFSGWSKKQMQHLTALLQKVRDENA